MIFFTAATDSAISLNVSFNESKYSIDESDELVMVELVLSDVSTNDITIQIKSKVNTATSK